MITLNETFSIPDISTKGKQTFVNPMGDDGHPDPCIVYCKKERCYYGISTTGEPFWGDDRLVLHRSANFEDLFVNSESRVVYQSNEKDDTYGYLWAPELHYIKGKWYIYTNSYRMDWNMEGCKICKNFHLKCVDRMDLF